MHAPRMTSTIAKPRDTVLSASIRSRAARETSRGGSVLHPQAHPRQPDAVDEEPEDGGQRQSRRAHSDGGEHLVQDLLALVDAAAVEELLGGGATELHLLVDGRALGGVEEGARRLLEPPAEPEHLGEARAQASQRGRRRGSVLEGETEEARGLVERELGGGLLGGVFGETRGAVEVARAEPVKGDGLGVGPFGAFERLCEPPVVRRGASPRASARRWSRGSNRGSPR